MYNITAYLTIKNKTFYTVLTYYVEGQRKLKWISTGIKENESKKKVEKKLIQIRDEFKEKLETITTTKTEDKKVQITFADFMIKWLDMIKHQIEESTYTGYKRQIEGRLKTYFTEHPILLVDLKPVHILDFYNWLYSEGLKGTTITLYHANIRKALDYAVQTDLIETNPAIKVGRPKSEQYIASYYTEDELNELFKIIKDTLIEVIVTLTAFYGLRRSEVLGLKWSAIDFENKTITIKHKVVTVTNENEDLKTKTKMITKDKTKNKSSYRTLPLFKEIEELLLYTRKMQEYYMSIFKDSYNKKYKDYVCLNELGNLRKPDYVRHKFKQILRNNNLREIRFHDLRHSCRNIACKKSISLREIQDWLGHSSSRTTERYTHLDSSTKIKSASAIENALSFNSNKNIETNKKDILDQDSNHLNPLILKIVRNLLEKSSNFIIKASRLYLPKALMLLWCR